MAEDRTRVSSARTAQTRREQARLAAERVGAGRARRARLAGAVALVLALASAMVVVLAASQDGDDDPDLPATASSGGLQTGPPPWAAQRAGLAERVAGLGFPPVGDQSYHAHALLSVYSNGRQVPVPADLGYDERGAHFSLHTHTPDGVIHMEADDPYPYTLAHVMTTWGVAFGPDRLGGDTAGGTKKVYIYVNGHPAAPDVELGDGDNVVIAYGTPDSHPKLAPAEALGRG